MQRRKVLFLCKENSCRSQMAEAIVNAKLGETWWAESAGTKPGEFVNPKLIETLAEIGIQYSGNPKPISTFQAMEFDLVISICESTEELCPKWLSRKSKHIYHNFTNPALTNNIEDFRKLRDYMLVEIPRILAQYS